MHTTPLCHHQVTQAVHNTVLGQEREGEGRGSMGQGRMGVANSSGRSARFVIIVELLCH